MLDIQGAQMIFDLVTTCTMCGATSGDRWESEPTRNVQISLGSRFWDTPETALSPIDISMLCDECQAGLVGLRKSGVPRK